jgi:hypothetical protein
MEVIRQYNDNLGREWMMPTHLMKSGAQFVNMLCQQPLPPVRQIDGEEETTAGHKVATVVNHEQIILR